MKINNHRLVGVPYDKSPNTSGVLDPRLLVMHYTAGYTAKSAIDTLTSTKSKASAHVVIDLDGKITQLVDFNRVAWHAGPSKFGKYNGLNNHSIGLEIVNIGFLKKLASGKYQDAYGDSVSGTDFEDLVEAKYERVGSGTYYWPTYPKAQLDAVEELTKLLIDVYDIEDVVSHEEIDTRGWKTDPGPAFPMKRFTKLLQKDDRNLDEVSVSGKFMVTAKTLNVRSKPGPDYGVVAKYSQGEIVTVVRSSGDWAEIKPGWWVHSAYLKKV